ncbi:MAG: glycosyltransferase family A protein [Succinivibrio sp.]|nr:glycosyltransferase family A protein [Succinivibrio sp.]MDY6260576.1 glycosyltransferase family A protein [Succinivibrio sp.]
MNINKKDISVIVPCFNCSKVIEKTLDSIVRQKSSDFIYEIIAIDDGSTDDTFNVLKNFSINQNIKIRILRTSNRGVSAARNLGISSAKTKWVALCDSDDIWLQNKLEIQTKIINANDDIDFLGGNHTKKIQKFFLKKIDRLYKINLSFLCFKMLPQTSTAIFKKRIFEEIGGYDEKQTHAEDGNFFMKICSKYGYYYSPETVVYYGNGKRGFGETGLSANTKLMHLGIKKNLDEIYKNKLIDSRLHFVATCFENFKYMIRLIRVFLTL